MHTWCLASLPYDYDSQESEVRVEFDANPAEPKTWDYPGSPAYVEITEVILDGTEINLESVPEDVMKDLEQQVFDYLDELETG